jgi:hypothetical protein
MEQNLKDQLELLLAEAEQAIDERSNGLMDRSDFRHLIERLVEVTRTLAQTCEELEQEQQVMSRRLSRSSLLDLAPPLVFQ